MSRILAACVFLCLLSAPALFVPDAGAALSGRDEAARIIYTAETLGHVHPCRTCGGSSQGGLARRPPLLRELTAGLKNPLVLAGPGEFYADRPDASPDKAEKLASAFLAAFAHMPYTALYLSSASVRDMERHGLALPANGIAVADKPETRFFRAGTLTAACVFLPSGTDNGRPSSDQILAAQLAAKEAAPSAALVIAVSPWGMHAENALAPMFAGYFHILLGGGEGIAVPGQATGDPASPGPLWLRSDRRGRAVNVLDIFSPPAPGTPWLDGIHFTSRLVFLEPERPEDETVLGTVSNLKDVE